MTKAGRLFEEALKDAGIDLKSGADLKVQVRDRGKRLRLVVSQANVSEFEAEILARSRRASETKAAYRPDLSVGETIRVLRKAAGLTLDALAAKAELSKGSLCSIETGERPAGLAVLKRLAKAMGIPVAGLVK